MNGWLRRGLLAGKIPLLLLALLNAVPVCAGEAEDRWWPTQAFPKAVVRTANQQEFPEPRPALQMMVHSVAGLAAKAVNEGHGDERELLGNPERGKIPCGWSGCFDQLAQLCPQAIEHALATRTPNDWFIEWGGGYYYPDHFGRQRTNRWELLARQARRTWALMKKTNERIVGFNFSQIDTPEARQACEVFAGQTDGLLAMLVFQYSPYEGGAGKVFWVRDRNGIEVPVITARYSIWEHANNRARAGTPAKVAREIRQTVEKTGPAQLPRYDWVIAHVWSYFKHAPGTDENAENMPQENAASAGGVRGYSPVTWCAERLPASVRVVSPEELAWRIRMQHDSAETKRLIREFR
jgi:hypothetical protein